MGEMIHLDFETKSAISLQDRGLFNYVTDSSTSVLLCAYAFGEGKVKLWQPHLQPEMPSDLRDALVDPFTQAVAWNATFERAILKYVLGIDKPIEEFIDPSIHARYLSIPGSLEDAGKVLKLSDSDAKIKDGKRLISLFCEPTSVGGEEGLFGTTQAGFRDWTTDPADWDLFCRYCVQDVVSERVIAKKLSKYPIPQSEVETWHLSERINETGLPIDMSLVKGARFIVEKETAHLKGKLHNLTGLQNTNSNEQILDWANKEGYSFSSMGKPFVERAMNGECELTPLCKEVLEIRKMTSKSSVNKFTVIARFVGEDARLRHQFVFYGAARTGRFSGRDSQVQNLPRPSKEVDANMDRAVELVRKMDYDSIVKEFSQPLDVVASTIRAGIRAPEGYQLVVADWASIESRVVGYVAGCKSIIDAFLAGKDLYKIMASRMFNKPYEEVTKEERNKGKVPILGCVYGLGGGKEKRTDDGDVYRTGLWGYAKIMNIEFTQEESHEAVKVFRNTYPEVVQLWKNLDEGAKSAIRNPGTEFEVGPIRFVAKGKSMLTMILPSGRGLSYVRPLIEKRNNVTEDGRSYTTDIVTFEGREQGTKSWGRIEAIGSKFTENAVQAIARDVLTHGLKLADSIGLSIIGHIHDEILCLERIGSGLGLDQLIECMRTQPEWTKGGLPLEAEGYSDSYYHK